MNDKILVKKYSENISYELESINFSNEYRIQAEKKLLTVKLKIKNLKPAEANILKQTCLSLGFDALINKDAVTCKCTCSDALITGNFSQLSKLCHKLDIQPFRLKFLSQQIQKFLNKPINFIIDGHEFTNGETYFMGIINVTPDSFSDGGNNYYTQTAINSAIQMISDGASIIDIGGESTCPNSTPVTFQTECNRVIPVIQGIRKINKEILLSIDTIHPQTAVKALENGVNILNTVTNIENFEDVFPLFREKKTAIVITHSKDIPPKEEKNDFSGDIVEHIHEYFSQKIDYLLSKNLNENQFILDVGIGFGKSVNDQFEILKRADEFLDLGYPVLYGISRKSFISNTFGTENRDEISKIYAQHLISKKINFLRVHDVKEHVKLKEYLLKLK